MIKFSLEQFKDKGLPIPGAYCWSTNIAISDDMTFGEIREMVNKLAQTEEDNSDEPTFDEIRDRG